MSKKYSSSKFLTIAPDTLLSKVISLMNQNHVSCVLIESQHQLQGIFTEEDLVKLLASATDFAQKTIAEVMTKKFIVLSTADSLTPSEIITLFQRHQIRHLPLVDAQSKVVGVITYSSLRQAINRDYFLRHRTVREAMQQRVFQATGDRSITDIVQCLLPFNNTFGDCFHRQVRSPFPSWTGAVVALLIASIIELCRRGGIIIPVPFMLLIITVSMSANFGGLVAGLWAHLVWSLFVIYAAIIGFGPATLTGGTIEVTAGILIMGLVAVVQGWTKEQNRWLTATLTHLNANLEQEIGDRTRKLAIAYDNLKQEMTEHIASKQALSDSERKFRAIFEQAGVGIYVTGLDKKLLQVNPKFCQFVGHSTTELKSLTFEHITHPDDRSSDNLHVEQMRANQRPTLVKEKRYIHKDGSVIWGRITVVVVRDSESQPNYFIAVVEDITKRKRAEIALQESEARFISWLNTCPSLVWTSGTDGLCNFFNTAWLDFTGKTLEQELGIGWTEGVHPEDLDFCLNTYNTAFARREKFTMEYRLHKSNGEYGWIYDEGIPRFKADGSFAGYIGTCLDISDRIKAKQEREQLLRQIDQERQFLESVLQQMPAGVMIVQPPSGKIILSNDNVSAILRHQTRSINNIEDYAKFGCLEVDGTPKKVEDYPLIKAFSGETTPGLEIDYLCGDGVIRTLFTNTAPIRNHQSQIIAAIATFYDVTEQKQAQVAQKEAENKSILLKEIHHRIKNNLQIVSALLDLQTEQIQDRAAQILLEKSQARIQTMALIHEKLYNSQNLERVNFLEYVTSLSRYLYDSFIEDFKQIQITLDLEPTELSLDLATPCSLIINELVVNSLQHGFVNQATGEIKIKFKKYAESYYLCIQDNGSGSNLEINTISNNTQFLGLSLVESLVEKQLKGTWKINQDNGFIIEITFPDI